MDPESSQCQRVSLIVFGLRFKALNYKPMVSKHLRGRLCGNGGAASYDELLVHKYYAFAYSMLGELSYDEKKRDL